MPSAFNSQTIEELEARLTIEQRALQIQLRFVQKIERRIEHLRNSPMTHETPRFADRRLPAGMVEWHGKTAEPPEDWDGGPYLCRDGGMYHMRGYDWRHGTGCWNPTADWDRIAYTPRNADLPETSLTTLPKDRR